MWKMTRMIWEMEHKDSVQTVAVIVSTTNVIPAKLHLHLHVFRLLAAQPPHIAMQTSVVLQLQQSTYHEFRNICDLTQTDPMSQALSVGLINEQMKSEFCFQVRNDGVWSTENQPKFWRNTSPSSSWSNNKPCMKQAASSGFYLEDRGDTFVLNVRWHSTDSTAL
jgi:hypothetical protein